MADKWLSSTFVLKRNRCGHRVVGYGQLVPLAWQARTSGMALAIGMITGG